MFVDDLNAVLKNHAQTAIFLLRRNDFGRSSFIKIKSPLGDVVMMRAHVAQATPGILAVGTPLREMTMHIGGAEDVVEAAQGSRPAPHVPINSIRLFLGG